MNFINEELRKIITTDLDVDDISFIGSKGYARLSNTKVLKVEIEGQKYNTDPNRISLATIVNYDTLKLSILNTSQGIIDCITVAFADILDGQCPNICEHDHKFSWSHYIPTHADYLTITDTIRNYIKLFR